MVHRKKKLEKHKKKHPDALISFLEFSVDHVWRRKWQPTPVFLPGESQGREPSGLPSMGSHRVGHD